MEPQINISESPTVKTKGYITADGVTTVYATKIFGIIAIVCAVAFLVLAVIFFTGRLFEVVFVLIYLLIAAFLFSFSFVQRYYIDSEKIIHRNMLGVKKQLYWNEIKTIQSNPLTPTDIRLCGGGTVIKIYPSFYFGSGSELILKFIRKYCTEAEWKSRVSIFS